ncbi:unnamed protein product [Phytomonas sp. EM1]|nr:unnamed protein product [Phytomonas sp. EM1]|eukprot:CCW65072.1 unnamed protein product [Phytomonas sp. isolate EM1]
MGIKGLWQALQSYIQDGHLSQFKGKRVSVDMYVWLHQAIRHGTELNKERVWRYFEELDARSSQPSRDGDVGGTQASSEGDFRIDDLYLINDRYIDYVVQKIDALLQHGVIPVCVFDGAEMPMKRQTNVERQERREASFRQALHLLEGNYRRCRDSQRRGFQTHARSYTEALECVWKAVDVSTELAHAVLQVLREERRVECLVAPYEAEAEMAYLCREGYVGAALSEDSDLIAYYCPCILAKLEAASGRCVVVRPQLCVPAFFAAMGAMSLPQRARGGGGGGGGRRGGCQRGSPAADDRLLVRVFSPRLHHERLRLRREPPQHRGENRLQARHARAIAAGGAAAPPNPIRVPLRGAPALPPPAARRVLLLCPPHRLRPLASDAGDLLSAPPFPGVVDAAGGFGRGDVVRRGNASRLRGVPVRSEHASPLRRGVQTLPERLPPPRAAGAGSPHPLRGLSRAAGPEGGAPGRPRGGRLRPRIPPKGARRRWLPREGHQKGDGALEVLPPRGAVARAGGLERLPRG